MARSVEYQIVVDGWRLSWSFFRHQSRANCLLNCLHSDRCSEESKFLLYKWLLFTSIYFAKTLLALKQAYPWQREITSLFYSYCWRWIEKNSMHDCCRRCLPHSQAWRTSGLAWGSQVGQLEGSPLQVTSLLGIVNGLDWEKRFSIIIAGLCLNLSSHQAERWALEEENNGLYLKVLLDLDWQRKRKRCLCLPLDVFVFAFAFNSLFCSPTAYC